MSLLSTCVIFLGPLIYLENKEMIDAQLQNAGNVIGHQTSQIKDLTAQHTSKGLDTVKQYTGTATAKAQELVGSARQRIPQPATNTTGTTGTTSSTSTTGTNGTSKAPFPENDFPSAPKTDLPASSMTSVNEFNEFNHQTQIPPSAKATYEGVA